jgi:hypothetical protein
MERESTLAEDLDILISMKLPETGHVTLQCLDRAPHRRSPQKYINTSTTNTTMLAHIRRHVACSIQPCRLQAGRVQLDHQAWTKKRYNYKAPLDMGP